MEALVTLKIYNVLGQEMATILDRQDMNEGTQEVQFNANEFSSGIYFYRIVAEGMDDDGATTSTYQTVKKMMLVK
jgi:Tfp pilus assembly protein PilX